MAHLALSIEANPAGRRQFLLATHHALLTIPGLLVEQAEVGSLALAWARGATAPHSFVQSPEGCALLLGYAVNEVGLHADAEALLTAWTRGGNLPVHDGYFVAVVYHVQRGLAIQCDPLGFFPIYHNAGTDVLVAGSSTTLCAAHPQVSEKLNTSALAGVLLTNGLVDGQPLISGLKRLGGGRQLEWTTSRGSQERESFRWQPDETIANASPAELRERMDAEFCQAIKRHQPREARASLLLSGGLDSRLMAGYLSSLGIAYSPITWGRESDFEFRAAQRVATTLGIGLEREPREATPEHYVVAARQKAHWEHLSGGFGNIDPWLDIPQCSHMAPYFWSGFGMDDVLGGDAMEYGRDLKSNTWSCETFLRKINHWGLAPAAIRRLLRPCATNDLLETLTAQLKRAYEHPGWTGAQRSVAAKLASRTRFHIGAVLHRLSYRSWPLLPTFDRRILQLVFNLPPAVIEERRLEMELLCGRAPLLARIPFDTNSFRFTTVQAKLCCNSGSWLKQVADRLADRGRRWYWQRWKKSEPRRYFRLYDLNSPGWRAIRFDAEAFRNDAYSIFDREAFDEALPGPDTTIPLGNPFSEGASHRALLGVLLCKAISAQAGRVAA